MTELLIHQRPPHEQQRAFIESPAKRKVVRAGRRSGKTTGIAIYAVDQFLAGRRVLYATPTQDQIERFWYEVTEALSAPIEARIFYKNETRHVIELLHTEQRIHAKTAWNADTLRGDYADLLILDEWQLMNEDAWELVGAPMLLDNNGDAVFIYTPPSLRSSSTSKARDKHHARKLFEKAKADKTGRWATFHFTSHDNPYISKVALAEIASDMTPTGYQQEIMALDVEDDPNALWTRDSIKYFYELPEFDVIVVAVDPSGSERGDPCGIVAAGKRKVSDIEHFCVLEDASIQAHSDVWSRVVVAMYNKWNADKVVAEANFGGTLVETAIRHALDDEQRPIGLNVPIELVSATRGKRVRAEPVAQLYKQGRGYHFGSGFSFLEDELCQWVPGDPSPNRLDALVWAGTALIINASNIGIFI